MQRFYKFLQWAKFSLLKPFSMNFFMCPWILVGVEVEMLKLFLELIRGKLNYDSLSFMISTFAVVISLTS